MFFSLVLNDIFFVEAILSKSHFFHSSEIINPINFLISCGLNKMLIKKLKPERNSFLCFQYGENYHLDLKQKLSAHIFQHKSGTIILLKILIFDVIISR